ncbi:MAG: hypothetical protein RMM08_05540 [Armatimonadota bacterium]|nr:hypothetical protein [Armatimonadota bacterium]
MLEWLRVALRYPGIVLIPLTPEIIVESTRLPPSFHRAPADQSIVATARVNDWAVVTVDTRLTDYPFVSTVAP